jgi:hypothetical protein
MTIKNPYRVSAAIRTSPKATRLKKVHGPWRATSKEAVEAFLQKFLDTYGSPWEVSGICLTERTENPSAWYRGPEGCYYKRTPKGFRATLKKHGITCKDFIDWGRPSK